MCNYVVLKLIFYQNFQPSFSDIFDFDQSSSNSYVQEAEWRQTSIGMIVSELGNIVDFQGIKTAGGAAEKSVIFNNKIKHVSKLIGDILTGSTVTKPIQRKMKAKKGKKKKKLGSELSSDYLINYQIHYALG